MKRTLLAILFATCLIVSPLAGLVPQANITRAQSAPNHGQLNKASADLKEKISRGHGSDLVRVIIQSTSEGYSTLEATVQDSGGSDV
ncbi:MAG TPA: hypothetical protein VGL91_22780, partial [Acidobacteriota bacterium]